MKSLRECLRWVIIVGFNIGPGHEFPQFYHFYIIYIRKANWCLIFIGGLVKNYVWPFQYEFKSYLYNIEILK